MSDKKLRDVLEKIARHSYENGYVQAHDDTVENNAGDPEECSGDWFESFVACGYLDELAKGITLADTETPETGNKCPRCGDTGMVDYSDVEVMPCPECPNPKEETPQDDEALITEEWSKAWDSADWLKPDYESFEVGWAACSKHRDEEVRRLRDNLSEAEPLIMEISALLGAVDSLEDADDWIDWRADRREAQKKVSAWTAHDHWKNKDATENTM